MDAWALLPIMSCLYKALSKEIDSVNISTASVTLPSNLPPHNLASFDALILHNTSLGFGLLLFIKANETLPLSLVWLNKSTDGEDKSRLREEAATRDSIHALETAKKKANVLYIITIHSAGFW